MRNWNDSFYSEEAPEKKTVAGLCIRCPIYPEVKATHKYNQLKPMCEKHYNETVATVKLICKSK